MTLSTTPKPESDTIAVRVVAILDDVRARLIADGVIHEDREAAS